MSYPTTEMHIEKTSIAVNGMHCQSCVKLIESEIGSLEGVKSVKADLIKNEAVVEYNPEKISLQKITSEITSLGYSTDGGEPKKKGGDKKSSLLQGVTYGLIPHIGCIAFIAASILGATVAMNFFKPLLMNRYFFHILILVSLGFATVSSVSYLKKNNILSLPGMKRKWKYLSVMYGSTMGINVVFFMAVFPLLANASLASVAAGAGGVDDVSSVRLQVDIPCPGHAPLIAEELKSLNGIVSIQFSYPNYFDVMYDSTRITREEMISLEVFTVYKATVVESLNQYIQTDRQQTSGCCGGGGERP